MWPSPWLTFVDLLGQLAWLLVWWIGIMALMVLGLVALAGALVAHWFDPSRSNCFVYVVEQWRAHKGQVRITPSLYIPWLPHFAWSPDGQRWWAFNPTVKYRRWLAPLWFKGSVSEELEERPAVRPREQVHAAADTAAPHDSAPPGA